MGSSTSKSVTGSAKSVANATVNAARPAARATERRMRQGQASQNIDIKGNAVASSSGSKSEAVLKDASDPSAPNMLSKNLASLGQAQAQSHDASRFTPDTRAARMLQRRAELEKSEGASADTVAAAVPNRLTVGALVTLLDARKEIKTAQEYRRLCADFNCDPAVVDRLCRHITSPSISLVRSAEHEKENTYLVRKPGLLLPHQR